MKPPIAAASILSADSGRLAEAVAAVDAAGAGHLLVRWEPSSTVHLHRVLTRIRSLGRKAGAVLDPASPIAFVEQVLRPKIRARCARCAIRAVFIRGSKWTADRDGANAARAIAAGANAIVAGSAIFGAPDYARAIAAPRQPARVNATGGAT